MHSTEHLGPRKIIGFFDGSVYISETVFFGFMVSIVIIAVCLWMAHDLQKVPKGKQIWAETIVKLIYGLVESTMGSRNMVFAPYMGTLLIFLVFGNALGLFGFRPVTADVNTTFALAIITFAMIQYNSIKSKGFKGYVKHFGDPYPFMYPVKIIEEISFPISLSFRLFGNITGGMIVMALAFTALHSITDGWNIHFPFFEFVIPLPLNLFFDVFEPVLQGFIFTMLTMAFVTMAVTVHDDEH